MYFAIISLLLSVVSVGKIYQNFKTVLDQITKQPQVCQKYSAQCHIFSSLLSVWKCGKTVFHGKWTEHLPGIQEVMGLIPVGDLDFFFVPLSCHVDQLLFTLHYRAQNSPSLFTDCVTSFSFSSLYLGNQMIHLWSYQVFLFFIQFTSFGLSSNSSAVLPSGCQCSSNVRLT